MAKETTATLRSVALPPSADAGPGSLLGFTGMVLVGSALLSATRQWANQLEQPPSEMAGASGSRPRRLPLPVPGRGGTDPRPGRPRPRQASSGGGGTGPCNGQLPVRTDITAMAGGMTWAEDRPARPRCRLVRLGDTDANGSASPGRLVGHADEALRWALA
jgi:hypothetical protein